MADIPQSRTEKILYATINGEEYKGLPESRIEELLLELKEVIEAGGGGGGGTTNYNLLENKPQIGGVTLSGNKSASDLSLASTSRLADAENMVCAEFFDASKAYTKDTYVIYNDGLYKFKSAHAAGAAWDATIVDEVDLLTVIQEATNPTIAPPVLNKESVVSENDVNSLSAIFTAQQTSAYILILSICNSESFPTLTSCTVSVNLEAKTVSDYYVSEGYGIASKYVLLNLEAGDSIAASIASNVDVFGTSASIMLIRLSNSINGLTLKDAEFSNNYVDPTLNFNVEKDAVYLLWFFNRSDGVGTFKTLKKNNTNITTNKIVCSSDSGWQISHGMCMVYAKALDTFTVAIQFNGYFDAVGVFEVTTGGSGGGSAELTDDLTASVTVGGITSGTTYEEGTSLEDILRDMLDPIAYPTLTNPSVSLAGSGSKLLETGATLAVTLTATFNRGSINPAYGTSGYRSGAVTGYSLNSGASQQGNTWSETVSAINKTFKCVASYAAGEQPKDSKGNNYSSPLAAGSVESGNVTYDFVDAMWANTAAIGTIAKLSLVAKSAKQRDMQFPAQTVANPEVFDIPASWTVTAVQVKNDLSGQYEDASDQFTVTDTTHNDAAGNSVNYKRYTFNKGFDTGARTVRVKWS